MHSAEEFLKSRNIEVNKINDEKSESMYDFEKAKEFDKMKSKVLKYALYKKRTEQEIRQKFSKELEENVLNDIIDVLKDNSYIDDYNYIERAISEYIKLKKMSIKEVKYKLLAKGINSRMIDEYVQKNIYELNEFELNSATQLVRKKKDSMEVNEIRVFLMKKWYKEENIKEALEKEGY